MSRLARGVAHGLLWAGAVMIAVGLVTMLLGVYVGSWPLRRLAGRNPGMAKMAAVQELLVAAGGLLAALRART